MLKKKVSFYHLSVHTNETTEDHLTMRNIYFSNNKIEEIFEKKYNAMQTTSQNTHVITLYNDATHKNYVYEIISYAEHLAFLRIGQSKDSNVIGIRNMSSLDINDVPLEHNQKLESYTYCIIDFTTSVISYTEIMGAPTKSSLITFFLSLQENENIIPEISVILNKDIVNKINKKSVISQININVSVPSDKVLSDELGVPMDFFDSIRNIKSRTMNFKIVAQRNKNIFGAPGELASFIDSIQHRFGSRVNHIHVNARDNGEKTESFDLLNSLLTQTAYIGDDNETSQYTSLQFRDALVAAYSRNKNDILRYIRDERGD